MEKLQVKDKLFYGLGAVSDVIMANIIFQLAMPIYNIELKVNAALIGLAISLPRLWDAFTDPFMGNISDNTRSRFGRRRPWLALGSLLAGIFCALMWMPPEALTGNGHFIYFLIISILFFTAYTVFSVPYNALGFEMTPDYDERTSVMSYKTFVMNIGSTLFLPWVYKMCFIPAFGGTILQGAKVVGIIIGVLIFVFGLLPAILCRERAASQDQEKIKLLPALKYTFKNKSFLMVAGIVFCILMAIFLAFPLMMYINLAIVFAGQGVDAAKESFAMMNGTYNTVYGALGIVAVPVINLLSRKFGKRHTLIAGLSMVAAAFALSPLLFSARLPYLQLVIAILASPGLSCVWVLTSSMLADVTDEDELTTGLRREGMFGAAFGLLVKFGLAGVMAVSGLIIQWSGFDAEIATQSASTVSFLRFFFAVTPLLFLAIAISLTVKFPLTRERMGEIQTELNKAS
ncbi:Inner membrane symporter YicJ [Pontiella desulfatans]|uniref:Inner membrane symporter YicJ n=1 Tax=Pontiella desulfatans TaxID=2750659 RepID=A0A6C2U018_PONDE|nr:MFS transporter [Pontiella desulfatans]VGO13262.1 Inner membrane symporter YicJ [Pontiella desulfatans]